MIALADTGADAINAIRQAAEFRSSGPTGGSRRSSCRAITDIDALGLNAAQGLILSEAFYSEYQGFDPRLRRALR